MLALVWFTRNQVTLAHILVEIFCHVHILACSRIWLWQFWCEPNRKTGVPMLGPTLANAHRTAYKPNHWASQYRPAFCQARKWLPPETGWHASEMYTTVLNSYLNIYIYVEANWNWIAFCINNCTWFAPELRWYTTLSESNHTFLQNFGEGFSYHVTINLYRYIICTCAAM